MREPRRIFSRAKKTAAGRFVTTLLLVELAIWIGIAHSGEKLLAAW